ncbi:MAG: restriction endonuclease [Acidobacteriota bacterium]
MSETISETVSEGTSIVDELSAGRRERSSERARTHFNNAVRAAEAWYRATGNPAALILKSEGYSQLALDAATARTRSEYWRAALKALAGGGALPSEQVAEAYAFVAVDCFQDMLSDLDLKNRQQFLRSAREKLDLALKSAPHGAAVSALLARKSSVLRYLGLTEISPETRRQRLEEAFRCATLAVNTHPADSAVLELANAEWTLARHQKTDEEYAARLRNAELHFTAAAAARDSEVAGLALARFYRLTFQPLRACEVFLRAMHDVKNLRGFLRDAHLLGEVTTQLWTSDYPKEVLDLYLPEARALLESALAAGFRTARNVVALAFVTAIAEGEDAGSLALSEICAKEGVAWDRALALASDADSSRLPEYGFALGIDQSSVWTRLGTYVSRFRKDPLLTETLYRTAVRIDSHDAIALTNLARFLIHHHGEAGRQEADRLLQKAESFADRRFTWWRAVRASLPARAKSSVTGKTSRPGKAHFENLGELCVDFERIANLEDRAQRGRELERLICELAKLTVGMGRSAYRVPREGDGESEIDGYFEHGPDRYRVECKWRELPTPPADIVLFADKLDVVGVAGVFLSMNGFTPQAIGRAHELRKDKAILLMDGDEARLVFNREINFDTVISLKRQYFNQRSEPYHRVSLEEESK